MKLRQKVAIVTGAGQGIGAGIAAAFGAEGARVVVAGRTTRKLERTVDAISAAGGTALPLQCDITDRTQIDAMVVRTVEAYGTVDILVNNAQSGLTGPSVREPLALEDVSEELASEMYCGGPLGSLWMMQACFPHLRVRGGAIVNFGSRLGLMGEAGSAPYAMAKEATRALTKVAAREWGPHGIRVNEVVPMAISATVRDYYENNPDQFEQRLAHIPLRRLGDCEADIGRAVAMLVSDDMSYLTGATLCLDGGFVIQR